MYLDKRYLFFYTELKKAKNLNELDKIKEEIDLYFLNEENSESYKDLIALHLQLKINLVCVPV